ECHALRGGKDVDSRTGCPSAGTLCAFDDLEGVVIVRRVVVKQRQPGDAGGEGDVSHVVRRAMTPSKFRAAFLARILRVVNQKVGAAQEFDMPLISGMIKVGAG